MPSTRGSSVDDAKELIRAAKKGDIRRAMELLKMYPALINARDVDGSTPLHCAVWKGQKKVVELLIDHGADVNAKNHNIGIVNDQYFCDFSLIGVGRRVQRSVSPVIEHLSPRRRFTTRDIWQNS